MKEENKLLVFDKKEILIILVFILGLFAASFIFGIKIGKDYSFSNSDVTKEEVGTLEVLSSKEEEIDAVVNKDTPAPSKEISYDLLKRKIEEELSKTEKVVKKNANRDDDKITPENIDEKKTIESTVANYYGDNLVDENVKSINEQKTEGKVVDSKVMASVYEGKWTIQLSSHKKIREAKVFANDFKVRGYEPIINEVDLGDKGTWYRVSLGAFDSLVEAKNYVIKESILFEEVDHVFIQFE